MDDYEIIYFALYGSEYVKTVYKIHNCDMYKLQKSHCEQELLIDKSPV